LGVSVEQLSYRENFGLNFNIFFWGGFLGTNLILVLSIFKSFRFSFGAICKLLSAIQKLSLIPCTHYTHSNARNNVKVEKRALLGGASQV